MKAIPTIVLLCCAVIQTPEAAAEDEKPPTPGGAVAQAPNGVSPIRVGNPDRSVQLDFSSAGVSLRAFDVVLLGVPPGIASVTKSNFLQSVPVWLNGQAVDVVLPHSFEVVERRASNEWNFLSVDLTSSFGSRLTTFRRHLLHVHPDLTVICDEIVPHEPSAIQGGHWFPKKPTFDAARGEWQVQTAQAGLTARVFSSPRSNYEMMESVGAESAAALFRVGVTNEVPTCSQLTVLVSHRKDARRSLAFKLLESGTAIGVRVHRDGLPTLIAFRKNTVSGQADLTGLKFTGPVAVDVFRPKRK